MKSIIIKLTIVLLLSISCTMHSQSWKWLKDISVAGVDARLAAGANEDVYGIIRRDYTLNLERYDSTGALAWQKPFGVFYDLTTYPNGDIFAWGQLYKNVTFGNTTLTGDQEKKPDFYAKLNNNADSLIQYFTMKRDNFVNRLAVGKNGETYLLGDIVDTITIKGQMMINSFARPKKYIAKLDPQFHILWYKFFETNAYFTSITEHGNELLLAGQFGDSLVIDNSTVLSGYNSMHGFVLKVDQNMNVMWKKLFQGCHSIGVGTDVYNDIMISGRFADSMRFESVYYYRPCSPNTCGDNFVVKLDPSANLKWATHIGEDGDDIVRNYSYTKQGEIFFSGEVNQVLYVNNDSIYNFKNAESGWNPFFAKLDQNGKLSWWDIPVCVFGGPTALATTSAGNAYWYGFAQYMKIGNDSINSTLSSVNHCFVARLKNNTIISSANDLQATVRNIILYPNPSTGKFVLANYSSSANVCIYDMSGRCVYRNSKQHSQEIDISFTEKGMYLLELSGENGTAYKKIIIE